MVMFAKLHHQKSEQELRMDMGHRDYIVRKSDQQPKTTSPEQKTRTRRKKGR